ncbi:lipopolysaccharide biosynthesis protein [Paenibacillus sp. NPDC101420]|uniref:lipopolysaccharide biosynthesis protein n=1 Tax=Paenibacillus sp. NPDC101420 TaxID=3390602 RepID=UPI003D02DBC4
MRTKKTIYNTLASILLQVITFISGIIIVRLLLVTYGSSVNGLRTSLTQIINYLYIFETGLSGAMIYSLYKPLAENDYNVINGILSAAKKAYKQVGFVFLGLLLILCVLYPLIINNESIDWYTIVFLTFSIGATGIINYFLIGSYTVLLTASQSVYILSLSRGIYTVVNTVIMVILIKLELNIALVYFISLAANLLNAYIIKRYSNLKFPYLDFKVAPIMSALSKRYDVVLHQISGMIVFNVPVLLLTIFTDLKTVSVYSIYTIIFTGVGMVIGVFVNSFTAALGDLIASKEYKLLKEAYSQYEFVYYGMVSFAYSCVLILGISFIKLYTNGITDASYVDQGTLLLFTLIGVLNNWKIPQSTIIISAGHYRETRHRAIIEAILTIIFSIPLVILYGLKGVLIGSSLGLLYRSIDLFYAETITKFKFKNTFIRIIRMLSIIIIAVLPINIFFTLEANSLTEWVIYAIIVSIYVGILVLFINFIFEKITLLKIIKRLKNTFFLKK